MCQRAIQQENQEYCLFSFYFDFSEKCRGEKSIVIMECIRGGGGSALVISAKEIILKVFLRTRIRKLKI